MTEEVTDVVVEQEAPTAVEPTTETQSSEVEETSAETENAEEAPEESTDEQAEVTQETEATSEETTELKPKSENRFQRLANENRDLKERLKGIEALQVPSKEDYLEDGQDETQAEISALKAQFAQRDAIETVTSLNNSIDVDLANMKQEFPILDPKSKEYNAKFANSILSQYDADTGAQYDTETGLMLSTAQLPYQYVKNKMDLMNMAYSRASVDAQRNVESMVSQSDSATASVPTQKTAGEETVEEMRERLSGLKF